MTDPYRPSLPVFPRPRLARAGLDEEVLDRLASEFAALDARRRVEFRRYVSAHADDALRARFAEGVQGVEAPAEPASPAATPTYEELNALTVDDLEDRVREWNSAHPEQHLAVSGRKGELIGRLLDAYEQERTAPPPAVEVSEPVAVATAGTEQPTGGTTTAAEQVLPTAPTATTTTGAPEPTSAASPDPAPAQTADAAGAGIAPSTSTEE